MNDVTATDIYYFIKFQKLLQYNRLMSNKLTTHGNTTRRYIVSIAFSKKKN